MNKIRQSQLYNIISNNDFIKLEQFFNENPDFNLHHELSVGKKYTILEQAVFSQSNDCAIILMNRMKLNELISIYGNLIINYGTNSMFNHLDKLINEYIEQTEDIKIIKPIIFRIIVCSNKIGIVKKQEYINIFVNYINNSSDLDFFEKILNNLISQKNTIPLNVITLFFNSINNLLLQQLTNNHEFKTQFENLVNNSKFDFTILLIEFYNTNNIDLDEYYASIIMRGEQVIKKTNKYIKNINLNNKVKINQIKNYYYDYFNKPSDEDFYEGEL